MKADTMDEKERYCYEDLGPLGRSNKLASQAMVFLVRGLYASWKLPISYFFTSTSVKHVDLSILLIDAIEKLLNCGFIVTAMIRDQGKNNVVALVKDLKMTKEKPFVELKGQKIYSFFDVPHIYKNLRNNFKSNNFIFKGKETLFKDLRDVYEIDKNSGISRSLLKITDSHMNPGLFQLMSCKLAMQLFSNSMAATIETCIMSKQLKSNTALNTLDMVKELNNLLDVLNIFRQRGRYNQNPTARVFRTTFRINVKINLMKPSIFSNCEEDADTHLLNNDNLNEATKHNIEDFNESSDSSSSVSSVSLSSTSFPEESVVDDYTP
ncbi:hypothetical protein AGLY_015683 [Aphis glycines]|uniref:Transposable element P transposase n=1 Tax=Aphis glycines TaxID=307491 RepID=A0A6G0T074_APHGL|nr:hypothetical protein AGLY_015683 [Aphis glycines]